MAAVAAASPRHPGSPKPAALAQTGHATFWECPAKTTQLLVAVNSLTLHPGQTLDITFAVKNLGTAACNYVAPYASVAPGPTSSALQAGPCGSIAYEVLGPGTRNVWPGTQPFDCPALGFAQLAPGATVSGSGSWAQTAPSCSKRVPPGTYTLVVGGHFSFPLHLLAH